MCIYKHYQENFQLLLNERFNLHLNDELLVDSFSQHEGKNSVTLSISSSLVKKKEKREKKKKILLNSWDSPAVKVDAYSTGPRITLSKVREDEDCFIG